MTHENPDSGSPAVRVFFLLAGLAVAAGIFFRFWGLGGAPLAVDEYYLGTSILNLAERCLPEFPCGGFYTRGLLVQYLTLILLYLGADLELAVRLIPVLASLMTVAAVWLIARRAGGIVAAALAAVLVSLSLWEIEFARFGRMYAPFQALFAWYVYFQLRHLIDGDTRAMVLYLLLSAIAIFVYAGAALLLALNFLPLLWPHKRWNLPHLFTSTGLLLAAVIKMRIDFRYLGVPSEQLPPDAPPDPAAASEPSIPLPVDVPYIPGAGWIILILGTGLLVLFLWFNRHRIRISHPAALFWLLALVVFAFGLVAFGVALVAAGILLRAPVPLETTAGPLRITKSTYALILVALTAAVMIAAVYSAAGFTEGAKDGLRYLFNYPDVYYKVLLPWMRAIPLTTVWLAMLLLPVLWLVWKNRSDVSDRFLTIRYLLALLIILVLLVGILLQPYRISRYTYFLYPVLLILASVGAVYLVRLAGNRSRPLAFAAALWLFVGFLATEDYGIRHLIAINDEEIRYRLSYDDALAAHYYNRWDFRGAAEFTNVRLSDGDRVVVFHQVLPHYLDRVDGYFIRAGTSIHSIVWGCGGDRELWSSAPLLDENSEVRDIIRQAPGTVWLLMRTPAYEWRDPLEIFLVERFDLQPEYVSVDGNLGVYAIRPEKRSAEMHRGRSSRPWKPRLPVDTVAATATPPAEIPPTAQGTPRRLPR